MKIIRSFMLLTVCCCTTAMVFAQELKPEVAKPVEIKISPTTGNKPSPLPELKPQPGTSSQQVASSAVTEKQLPVEKQENKKPTEKPKLIVVTADDNGGKNVTRPARTKPAVEKVQQQ